MDYATLIADKSTAGSIANWTNHSKLPAPAIVAMAESWIYSRLRVRDMISTSSGVISTGSRSIDISSINVLEPIAMRRYGEQDGGPIRFLDPEHFESRTFFDDNNNPVVGTPTEAVMQGDVIHLNALTDRNILYRLVYFGRPAALSASGTNVLTQRYEQMLLAICLHFAYLHMQSPELASTWLTLGQDSILEANREFDMAAAGQYYAHFWEDG
jgi:hypothetical protein